MARYRTGNSVKDRRNRESGGWRNWDTHQTNAIIGNDRKTYEFVKKNKARLLRMKKEEKLAAIDRASGIGLKRSGISYKNVDYRELNSIIDELE